MNSSQISEILYFTLTWWTNQQCISQAKIYRIKLFTTTENITRWHQTTVGLYIIFPQPVHQGISAAAGRFYGHNYEAFVTVKMWFLHSGNRLCASRINLHWPVFDLFNLHVKVTYCICASTSSWRHTHKFTGFKLSLGKRGYPWSILLWLWKVNLWSEQSWDLWPTVMQQTTEECF